jgi:transcriptional regulator with XRE-family HTH domain
MTTRHGGADRVSTKTKLAAELAVLGRVLARTRERAGVKQSDASVKLGLPASYLSKIENGTRRVDVIELLHIAEAIGVDAANIIRELEQELRRSPSASATAGD